MIENLTPEAERRMVVTALGLEERELGRLRDLPHDEARWRIEHEHKVFVKWSERRRDFQLADCLQPKVKKQKPPSPGPIIVVTRHSNAGPHGIVGMKMA